MAEPEEPETIGQRIAAERKLAGLTARELATSAHVSYSLLSKVEAGLKPASPALVAACARALRTSAASLLGQPRRGTTEASDRVHAGIGPIRAAVALAAVPLEDDLPPAPLSDLAARVRVASGLAHEAKLAPLGAELPPLLADLRIAAHHYSGADLRRVWALTGETWTGARMLARRLGYEDLAAAVTEQYVAATRKAQDPYAVAVSTAYRAAELIFVDEPSAARTLMAAAQRDLGEPGRKAGPQHWTAWGWMHIQSGLAAARARAGKDRVTAHLDEAARAAAALPPDAAARDWYRLTFHPASVLLWRVSLALEQDDDGAAIDYGKAALRTPEVRGLGLTRNRVSLLHIEMARAYSYAGDRDAALRSLQRARRVAPLATRHHPMVRETVYTLGRQAARTPGTLQSYVRWLRGAAA